MARFQLIDDAKRLAPRLWSVRLALLASVLSAVDVALPYLAPAYPSRGFALLAVLVGIAAALARLVAQPSVTGRPVDEAPPLDHEQYADTQPAVHYEAPR